MNNRTAILWVVVPAVVVGAAAGVALGLWSSMGAGYRGLIIGASVAIAIALGQWALRRKRRV
jgi:hypothetical protein